MATEFPVSQNFAFLRHHSTALVKLGSQAEQYFVADPNTCMIKLWQFTEVLAQLVAAKVGLYEEPGESQVSLLRRLNFGRAVTGQKDELFHVLRKIGNNAMHNGHSDLAKALSSYPLPLILRARGVKHLTH